MNNERESENKHTIESDGFIDHEIFSLPGIQKQVILLIVLTFVIAFLTVVQALSLASVIESLWRGELLEQQLLAIVLFLVSFVLKIITTSIKDAGVEKFARSTALSLREDILKMTFHRGIEFFQTIGTGNLITLIMEGVDSVEKYIKVIVPKIINLLVVPLVLLVTIWLLDWVSGVIALLAYPFIVLYMIILGYRAKTEASRQYATFQRLSNTFMDGLRGIDTLKFFGISKNFGRQIYEVSENFRQATMKTLRIAMLSSAALDLLATGSIAAVAIMMGFRLIDTSLAFLPALSVLILIPEYFKPIREYASDYHASLEGRTALRIMKDLERAQSRQEILSRKQAVPTRATDKLWVESELAWSPQTKVRVCNLTVAGLDHEILTNISFSVSGARCIGIVGKSGSGKSTLINTLAGFSPPQQGSFFINNKEYFSLCEQEWHKQIGYLPQNPYLFHGTLRENISFYRPDATEEEVCHAVSLIGLDSLVKQLPHGIDTVIGEGGRTLSGGQAQRIALARVLIDPNRRILLFDEPTAHLDIETEWELKNRMLPLFKDRLIFFATHRLHWMSEMDYVLVLQEGKLFKEGTPEALLKKGCPVASLATSNKGANL